MLPSYEHIFVMLPQHRFAANLSNPGQKNRDRILAIITVLCSPTVIAEHGIDIHVAFIVQIYILIRIWILLTSAASVKIRLTFYT